MEFDINQAYLFYQELHNYSPIKWKKNLLLNLDSQNQKVKLLL